jgi:phosphoserine aminotransferase
MKHNFYAGPAILPQEVLAQAAKAVQSFDVHGLSLLEISHRSKDFTEVMDETFFLTKEILGLEDHQKVLFLGGGASSQFFMTAMNLLSSNETAAYINTGTWSTKAIKEVHHFGKVHVAGSSEDKGFTYIPKNLDIPSNAKYLHYTSNNTIYGTQFQEAPQTDLPLVCDMSSDIFSKPIDASRYQLIYAGAQKNLGPAGATLIIVNEDILGQVDREIPTMLDYRTHIKKGSMFNTPPVFPIYVCMLTLRWIKKLGGVQAMHERNEAKAALLYGELDRNSLFAANVVPEDRSRMNATFKILREDLSDAFLSAAEEAGCIGLKGHRSVGGFRASTYNAMDIESVQALVDVMKTFEAQHG